MEIFTWLTYISVISALIIIPGPSSLLITMHGLHYGYRKTNYTIIGNLLGSLVLMSLSAIGLSALLLSSEVAFSLAKYIGAAYLIYLGLNTILTSSSSAISTSKVNVDASISNWSLLRSGFFTGVSNPKDLIFFASLFPAFLSAEYSIVTQLIVLMSTWLFIDYFLKILYLLAGGKIKRLFSSVSFRAWFNRLTGGLFITFGALLAGYNKQ